MSALLAGGFANYLESEAIPGALPVGRNSPQKPPLGLFAELLSGSAFTAPRHDNRRTWMYRCVPSVVVGRYAPYAQPRWTSGAAGNHVCAPNPLRWGPSPMPTAATDFIDGLATMVANGCPEAQHGMAALVYTANASMQRVLINADAEMLLIPQQGRLQLVTELGELTVPPGHIALIPKGLAFAVMLPDGTACGYAAENYGAAFRLPELGPIGSNGLANPRDFIAPQASTVTDTGSVTLIKKSQGALWQATSPHSPFNVVAWHGNLWPSVYDCARFNTIGTVSFDHPDPSIFTVLTSPSDTPGVANCDFVIFPPRWMVAEDTFRPPWYHRNVMSEFMGLILGRYDAKPGGFVPGGSSLHNSMVPHGPDTQAHRKATDCELTPHKLDNTLAFMLESRYPFRLSDYALHHPAADTQYAACWQGLG